MKSLDTVLNQQKRIRVLGIDDAPFKKARGGSVDVSGIVCTGTRFEGMLWFTIEKDGMDATQKIIDALKASKFLEQLHVILLDGIALGGFNVVEINRLALALSLPCIAVMRKPPNLIAIEQALKNFADGATRWQHICDAGEIFERQGFVFQVAHCSPENAVKVLHQLTDTGKVPEALRLAHLIGAAIKTGESSKRA